MNFALSRLAYAGGYLLALAKSRFYPRLDVLAVVEAVGRGLERGRQSARPRGSAPG